VLGSLKVLTIDGAHQYFEKGRKASNEAGKPADLVILTANPIKAEAAAIKDIRVAETIKDGKTAFMRETPTASSYEAQPAVAGAR